MDTHRSAADLPAVQHHVVGLRQRLAGIPVEIILVAVHRAGKRVMQCVPALVLRVPFEHREIHTHSGRQPFSANPRSCPILVRSAPSASFTTLALPAPKKIRSPSFAPPRSRMIFTTDS